jgi:hypothetical protein
MPSSAAATLCPTGGQCGGARCEADHSERSRISFVGAGFPLAGVTYLQVVAAGVGWCWGESNRDVAGSGALAEGIGKRRGLCESASKALDSRPGEVRDVVVVQAGEVP